VKKTVKKIVPSLTHSSGLQFIAACNCGKKQANREDPYTLYEANCGFYSELEEDCCKDLNHVDFPVFNPLKATQRVEEAKEGTGKDRTPSPIDQIKIAKISEYSKENSADVEPRSESMSSPKTPTENMEEMSLSENKDESERKRDEALDLGKEEIEIASDVQKEISDDKVGSNESPEEKGEEHARTTSTPTIQDEDEIILEVLESMHLDSTATTSNNKSALAVTPNPSPSKVDTLFSRSNSYYLPHMKTLGSQSGLKPEFSSWSLVMMGPSSVYSHSAGLSSMPGFMSSSKFLLPWEIPLTKVTDSELARNWPNILEYIARRASILSSTDQNKQQHRISVKVFLGFEYECPRGHRFMVSAPDQAMKSSNTMRGAAQELVASAMPLYMACPCKGKTVEVAQLMRIHIVTPKAPVYVTLLPQVQPIPDGPIFVTGWDAPVKLSINSYWVMRLPYVYWGEGGAHLPPTTPPTKEKPSGTLLKGCIIIDEDYHDT